MKLSCLLPLLALGISAMAMADDPQLYKWTDTQGTVHYSDQPPSLPAADLVTSALPSFPPEDPAKPAQRQAALIAQVAALQQLVQARQAAQDQERAAALARQQAEEQAALQAQQATQDQSLAQPIYMSSVFVPRVYRTNLYLPVGHRTHPDPTPAQRLLPGKPLVHSH